MKSVKRWRVIVGFLGVMVVSSAGYVSGHAVLVNAGYCFSSGAYITREEILQRAVEYFFRLDSLSTKRFVSRSWTGESRGEPRRDRGLYRTVEEFLLNNPGCCEIVERGEDGYSIGLVHWYLDGYTAIVRGQYASRYMDDAMELRSERVDRYVIVSNCGDVRAPD